PFRSSLLSYYGDDRELHSFPTRRSSDLTDETEVGLIYLNYHDRAPMVDVDYLLSDRDGFGFNHRYFEDIKMLGATFSTSFGIARSEEHTSELQSREKLVCRLLLEKKNNM